MKELPDFKFSYETPNGEESVCDCHKCKECCARRVCWPTPDEALALIKAGHGDRLMRDYWVGGWHEDPYYDIMLLCPATVGYEGDRAPSWPDGACTFFKNGGLCELHEPGLKPIEGRIVICHTSHPRLHGEVAQTWNSNEARRLVEYWMEEFER